MNTQPLSPDFNFHKASQFIRSAAQKGAQLAVLPEYHLTNWVPDTPGFWDACLQWKTYLDKYLALAEECRICIVPGTIVEALRDDDTGEEKLVNVSYFISHEGKVLGRYEKKNLWYSLLRCFSCLDATSTAVWIPLLMEYRHPERPHLASSTTAPHTVIETPIGPVGLLICWDLAFPEAFRELIAAGAKTIIIPTFWTLADCSPYGLSANPRAEALFLESTLTARAFENTCCIIFVNAGGAPASSKKGSGTPEPEEGKSGPPPDLELSTGHYAGLSRVALPFVGALGDETKDSAEEGMSIVDVNMQHVEEAEANYKVRADMDSETWHYSYRHQGREEKL